MKRWLLVALALLFGLVLSGCVVGRTITSVGAHPDYNNYKVQTLTTRFAVITVWFTAEMWTCHKEGDVFHCTELSYEESKAGFKGYGRPVLVIPPPPAEAPASAPTPAPAPAPAPPPAAKPAPAPAPAPTPAPAPAAPPARPAPPPAPPAASAPPPAPPAPAPAPAPKSSPLYDAPRH